jgi:hypothetical protein
MTAGMAKLAAKVEKLNYKSSATHTYTNTSLPTHICEYMYFSINTCTDGF